ncbi:amidohydrolase [Paenarthrobacter sp. NPDC089322]|uniref:amidohydrolase n=1 Tax=Paenarthrobacter sp. NPDC089322 TaxID=3155065 RepID=UPI0034301352
MKNIEKVSEVITDLAPEFVQLSDAVWDEPELRWEEHVAVRRHCELAEKYGFTITPNVAGLPTAFSAEKGTTGPIIAFLGEYDALADMSQDSGNPERCPNPHSDSLNGHGCGHHLLGAGSLLAAVATARYLEENSLPGRVRYYGCPAEEAAAGKTYMVRGGAFDDVDAAITWHPNNSTVVRQVLTLAYAQVYFHFTGIASHAGVSPHLGRSALDALELTNTGLNYLREHIPDSARIHYAITDAGGLSPNVVPSRASGFYIVRAEDTAQMRELFDRVVKVAEGAAHMTETKLTIEFDGACSEILPNDTLEQALHSTVQTLGNIPFTEEDHEAASTFTLNSSPRDIRHAKQSFGWPSEDPRSLHESLPLTDFDRPRTQMTGSSDVGDVSWSVPTVQILASTYALGTPFHSWQAVAQGKTPAAHKGMVYAAKAMAGTALSILTDPDLLAAAKAEHARATAENPYVCPVPDDVVAPPLRTNTDAGKELQPSLAGASSR